MTAQDAIRPLPRERASGIAHAFLVPDRFFVRNDYYYARTTVGREFFSPVTCAVVESSRR